MKETALLVNALLGFCSALPYKWSAFPLGLLGMIWVPLRAYLLLVNKQAVVDAENERKQIEGEVNVMFAKRAQVVDIK